MGFKEVSEGIYRLDIFYDDITTSVFAFENKSDWFVMDFGVSDKCAKECIIPEIQSFGIKPKYLLCSYMHFDHNGGIAAVATHYPEAEVVFFASDFEFGSRLVSYAFDGQMLLERYKILNLKGHTDAGMGILDTKNKILVAADALQMYGIGEYGTNIDNPSGYIDMLNRIRGMNLHGIISSHSYYPYGDTAFGKEAVENYIDACFEALKLIAQTAKKSKDKNPEKIAENYRKMYPNLPVVSA